MQKNKLHILSTRPLDKALIKEAASNNVVIDEISFIDIKKTNDPNIINQIKELSKKNSTVVFTSMNAVEIVTENIDVIPKWKVYCIGNTTKKLVENYLGGEAIIATADYAEELADKIIEDDVKEVVFFCGNIRRETLPEKLKSTGIKVKEVVVYDTLEKPKKIDKVYDAVLFYSPSAVNSFFKANNVNVQTIFFVIGKTTAEALQQYTKKNIIIADTTGKEEMVKGAIAYFSKQKIN